MLRISPNSPVQEKTYEERLQTLKVLHTPESTKIVSYWLSGTLLLFFVTLFLPWQQNIRAEGELTALSPKDRPQTVETPIAGRILEWNIAEGQYVDSGAVLVVIGEIKDKYFDPDMLLRLEEQIKAKEDNIRAKAEKIAATDQQIAALREGLRFKLEQAENKIIQNRLKVTIDSNNLIAANQDLEVANRQIGMFQVLFDSGLVPLTRLETAKIKAVEAQAKQIAASNKLDAARNDLIISIIDLSTIRAEAMDKISKAESERSATLAELYDSEGSLAKQKNEYVNMQVRTDQRSIRAPQSGYIIQALKNGIGETVKENEALITLMPNEPKKAVALYIKAMDVPLISPGRHVRLEFDGWPALQVTGWPSVAVGTFGGKVEVIDMVDSKAGKYRVLITPDRKVGDEEWPRELRLGSGVYGWVMLDDVPIWFELWRQLNGFPPSLQTYSDGSNTAGGYRPTQKTGSDSKDDDY